MTLPNAAKPDRLPRSTDSPVFGMATRLAKDKGIFEFLDVAEAIHAQRSGARFVIAGEGPERSKLEEETNRRGLSGVFFFPGYIRDLDAFWSGIDIALFTAAKEPDEYEERLQPPHVNPPGLTERSLRQSGLGTHRAI